MAQSGYTPIQHYKSTTSGNVPSAANLSPGELGINIADNDMSVYMENASGAVKRIINNPAGLKYPTADGTAGQVIQTDGAGNLSFDSVSAPAGTPIKSAYAPYADYFFTSSTSYVATGITCDFEATSTANKLEIELSGELSYNNGETMLSLMLYKDGVAFSNRVYFSVGANGTAGLGLFVNVRFHLCNIADTSTHTYEIYMKTQSGVGGYFNSGYIDESALLSIKELKQ